MSVTRPPERAVHLRPSFLLVVAAGGAIGTAVREGLVLSFPGLGGATAVVLAINVAGAFLLGLLLEALVLAGPDAGRLRLLRLLAGTGFCGGFTTYSTLASAVALLASTGALLGGVLYGLATVVLGGAASWAGIVVGARTERRAG